MSTNTYLSFAEPASTQEDGTNTKKRNSSMRAVALFAVVLAALVLIGVASSSQREGRVEGHLAVTAKNLDVTSDASYPPPLTPHSQPDSEFWGHLKDTSYKGIRADIAFGNVVGSTTTFPYIVRVLKNNGAWCTGNIVAPDFVLTAAHCVSGEPLNAFSFVAGTISTAGNPTRQSRTATAFHIHQNYRSGTWISDIALVKLNAPFSSNPSVNGIGLISARPAVGTAVRAAGWGWTEANVATNQLKEATMNVIACNANEANDICTRGGSGNTCSGDSGGPLVTGQGNNQELVGLNSYSWTSCRDRNGNIDVFETTTPFINWVNGYLPVNQLELVTIPSKSNYANCNGLYTRSGSILFNKMVYKNSAKARILAYNNHQWVVTATHYLNGLLANPPSGFGGYHFSTNGNVNLECAKFPTYVITPQKVKFTLKSGANNHANANGDYVKTGTWLNGYPIYVNSAKSLFVGYAGTHWVVTHTYYQNGIVSSQAKNFGGYHFSTNGATTLACSTWSSYTLSF